jgi:integral membrane protein (TIGR01906 family)
MSTENTLIAASQKTSSLLYRGISWLVTILVPVALVLTAVRLMMTPVFLRLEYNTPNFPPDSYGFTKEDRLYWSRFALDYLLNEAGISYLGDLRFKDGTLVYNERELRHMVDVKNVVRGALLVWYLSLAALLILGVWAWLGRWLDDYRRGLRRGGWLTVILLGLIIFFVLLSFGVVFVAFHNVFFAEGTWMFLWSDTLIRMFPERFWRDIFIYVGFLAMAGGIGMGLGLGRK